ncbi:MAG: hypothetical protein JXR37_01485 [Kiritimatiellae bacterium]|nr:hypothetical protein [Kiritimatiellia bacterium]
MARPAMLAAVLAGLACCGRAADFAVGTVAQLQNALTAAQTNQQNDTITLAAGTYDVSELGGGRLSYTPGTNPVENFALTLDGGGAAVIDGAYVQALKIDMFLGSQSTSEAEITVKGITFVNGRVSDSYNVGGGLYLENDANNNGTGSAVCVRFNDYSDLDSQTAGNLETGNNITRDPDFVDAPGANFRLGANSPCVNAGTNQPWMSGATDPDDRPRVLGGTVDMGAYEGGHTFWFRAVGLTNNVLLRWAECGVPGAKAHIQYRTDTYPTATNDGTFVYAGTNLWFEHTGVPALQTNYYTIWIAYDGTNFGEP